MRRDVHDAGDTVHERYVLSRAVQLLYARHGLQRHSRIDALRPDRNRHLGVRCALHCDGYAVLDGQRRRLAELWLMPPWTGCRVVGGVAGAVTCVGLLRGLARFATQAAGPGGVDGRGARAVLSFSAVLAGRRWSCAGGGSWRGEGGLWCADSGFCCYL